jgi:hypothetical protein
MSCKYLRVALLLAFTWLIHPSAFAAGIGGHGSAITYQDEQNNRHIWLFTSTAFTLVSNHYDGTKWTWTDHGNPARDSAEIGNPQAITYVDNAGNRRIYVFATTTNRRLKLLYFNGFQWQWVDQGGPDIDPTSTSAITYVDPTGNRRIYLFGTGTSNSHLVTNYWNGSSWLWADNGHAPGAFGCSSDTITYEDDQGARKIDVFCSGVVDNTHHQLLVNSWNGSSWSWLNHGGEGVGTPHALTFTESTGSRRIHVVADLADTPTLHSRIDGSWYWITLGKPVPGTTLLTGLDAIAYTDVAANRRMQVFAQFGNQMWSRTWDGAGWQGWLSHGAPAGTNPSFPVALTYWDSRASTQRTHLFVVCSQRLCDLVNDGGTWQWQDLGQPAK